MPDFCSGGLERKPQSKGRNLNPFQLCIISQPTHMQPQTSSCIELTFTDQPNLVVVSGVHPSLHSNCHHQITNCKLNRHMEFPPLCERLIWHCNRANVKKKIEGRWSA